MRSLLILLSISLPMVTQAWGANRTQMAGVAFYNLENLFDTIPNNPKGLDKEFTPRGERRWDTRKYRNKINNLAYAISQMAQPASTPEGPSIIGLAEVENRAVLRDLVSDPQIASWHLQIVHEDSPDPRGIDVALLYNPRHFEVENITVHPLTEVNFRTRDQLCVVGRLMGERIGVIVNHWPSRLGGTEQSEGQRHAAARLCRHIADSLRRVDPDMGIIIMGDFNEDPMDPAVAQTLGARKTKDVDRNGYYNPWWQVLDNGVGTITYRGQWNLFDQIIVSGHLCGGSSNRWTFYRAHVHNDDFLREPSHRRVPLRTYSGGEYQNGYSDHLPTQIFLRRTVKTRK